MRHLAGTSANQFYALHLVTGKVISLGLVHRDFKGSRAADTQRSAATA
jgi:hypothetical protein